jgi:predicted dehydrogenase
VEGTGVVAICGIIKERAETSAKKFGIPLVYEDYHKILEMDEVEAVRVLTYNYPCG